MGKKKALIVGINEYEDPGFEKLKYAENDAKAIYDILINPDIGDFKKEDVTLLTGKTKSEVEESLETTLNEAKKDDLVFIYFAGHGKLDKSANLCLAAQNTKTDKLHTTSVHLENIRRIIDESDCKRVVFIIDSCFSGAVGQSFRSEDVPTESFEQISGQGKVIISASQAYERARERDDIGHGIFTYNLVKGLEEGEADHDEDGYISIDELYRHVCDKVKAETKGQQVPMKWGIDEKGEIVIAKSIKTLEKKRAEIERLSKITRELQNQGRLDEALGNWNKLLQLDPKNIEATQGIKQVEEEKKKRAELEAKIDKLFDYYKKGSIPGPIYNKAFGIIRNPHSTSDKEGVFTRLVEDLVSNNLTVENFVLSWNRIEKPGQEQIAVLYEQAQGLARVGQWRQALEKMKEIQVLDPQFADPEGIVIRAQEELTREAERSEQEGERKAEAERIIQEKVSEIRQSLLLATSPSELQRLMYEADEILSKYPHHTDARLLKDQIVQAIARVRAQEELKMEARLEQKPQREERHLSIKWPQIALGVAGVILAVIIGYYIISNNKDKTTVLPPKIEDFKTTPETIEKGKSSTLSWKTSNAKEVEINSIGKVSLSGSETVSPTETTTYTLVARNEKGETVKREVTVNVTIPPPKEIPKGSQVLYEDNFATLDPAWGVPSPNLSVKDGKLIIQPEVNQGRTVINQANLFEDMDASIKVRIAKSDDLSWGGGLVFWAKDYNDYYCLMVTGDGRFSVGRWVNGRWLYPVAWRENAAIKKGLGEWNDLRVVTKGNQATVYINATEVALPVKGESPQGGSFIGMYGSSPKNSQNVWEFSDLKITKP